MAGQFARPFLRGEHMISFVPRVRSNRAPYWHTVGRLMRIRRIVSPHLSCILGHFLL